MSHPNLATLAVIVLTFSLLPGRPAHGGDVLDEKIEQSAKLAQTENDDDHEKGMIALESTLKELEESPVEKDNTAEARRQFLLGKTEFYLDRQDDAGKYLGKAIGLAPANAEYHFFRGQARAMNGDPVSAEGDFINATRLAPKEARYWYHLGLCQGGGGKTAEAITAFQKAVEADPNHAKAALMIGAMLTRQGKRDEALAMFQKAAGIDPTYVLAHMNIGQVFQDQEKYADSLKAFRDVLKLKPDEARALAKVIQCEQALGMDKERDADRAAIAKLHADGKFQDGFYCRDQFVVSKTRLIVFEYFELEGEHAVRYSFDVLADSGDKLQYKISLGSPQKDNEIAREHGDIGKNERVYFLDADYPDGAHKTFGVTRKIEPSYEDTKKRVISIIKGEIAPASSLTPGKDGGGEIKLK